MRAEDFRGELRQRLQSNHLRVLLRIVVSKDNLDPVELTGGEILSRAEEMAARYVSAGSSQVVLLLLPHSVELFLLHLGLLLRGAVPAVLAWPTTRMDPGKYQRNLLHQLRTLPGEQLITLPSLASNLSLVLPFPATACSICGLSESETSFAEGVPVDELASRPKPAKAGLPADAVFLQFSGGTTGAQKCIVVTAKMLSQQLRSSGEVCQFSRDDNVVSWLPIYHDMGLIDALWLPLWHAVPSLHFSPVDWVLQPELLFYYLERHRGTFAWLPNFAFSYLAAQRKRMSRSYSLGSVRAWMNGSEPVRLRSMLDFAKAFADWGVTPETLQAVYGMAENVANVTLTPPGSCMTTFPRSRLSEDAGTLDKAAFTVVDDAYVSSGRPVSGVQIRIRDAAGRLCEDAKPGYIELRSECLFSGYWENGAYAKSSFSEDGWYLTGDYGFCAGKDVFVIGRIKDTVIVGGKNVLPEDVEAAVNSLPGIHQGRVVAFGVPDEEYGTESLAIVAELKGDFAASAAQDVQRQIQEIVVATIGIAPRHVKVCPQRWIVKSTNGKLSRKETRARFLRERFHREAKPAIAGS